MSLNKQQGTDMMASQQVKHGTSRSVSLLTNSEIESLRNLKKERAAQFREIYKNVKLA